jgi:hypothetical protein
VNQEEEEKLQEEEEEERGLERKVYSKQTQ